jgi:hypothetical protein
MAAWVRSQVKSCGIYGEQSVSRAGFLWLLRFPLPILIPLTVLRSSALSAILSVYIRLVVADIPSGLSLTPP